MAGYRTLRKQLDDLGYYQPLVVDAVPLVEALLHDLLTTTNSLKLCKEAKDTKKNYNTNETENNELKNVSKPKASSTPILSSTPEETNAKIISLKSRTKDLENLNKECNSIIRRQQIELDAKSTKILKLELSSGNSRAKVVTHHDRPLIISDSLKPRIEMTRLISTKEHSKESRKPILECNEDDVPHSQIDVVKIYEKRNQHLDRELAKLQTELDTARKLLSQAEKQWYWNTSNGKENVPSNIQKNSNEIQPSNAPECHKSNYMIKLLNENTHMKARLSEIDKHSNTCFHGKAIPPIPIHPSCCCGHVTVCQGECNPMTSCCKQSVVYGHIPAQEGIRSMVESSHAQLRQSVCIKSRPSKLNPNVCKTTQGEEHIRFQDKMHEELHNTQENFRKLQEANKELRHNIKEITQQKVNLKQKLQHVETQLNILIDKEARNEIGGSSKIQELIKYIEAQRDIYRNSVEQLLNKIDPDRVSKLANDIESCNMIQNTNHKSNLKQNPKSVLKNNPSFDRKYKSNNIYSRWRGKQSLSVDNEYDDDGINLPCEDGSNSESISPTVEVHQNIRMETEIQDVNSKETINSLPESRNLPTREYGQYSDTVIDNNTRDRVDDILEEIIRGNNNVSDDRSELVKTKKKLGELEAETKRLSAKIFEKDQELKSITEQNKSNEKSGHKICCDENQKLNQELLRLQQQVEEMELHDSLRQHKSRQHFSDLRDTTDNTIEGFQRDLRIYQTEIDKLKSQVSIKESHLYAISREKDALQNQLDEKTIQHEDIKTKYRNDKSHLDELQSTTSGQEQRVQQCLSEIGLLQTRLRETVSNAESVKSRLDAEKSVNREIRIENMKLKEDVLKSSTESEGKAEQIRDLRANIRTYVTEVKRIEDLLNSREKERGDLLEQYRHLSDEIDKSEIHRRDLESKVSHLKLELSTRSSELKATESRIADMEQDLIELSLANESYRSQVATLATKFDLVDTELRAVKSQTTWATTEFTDVQQLAAQLDDEKLALQRQISDQAQEIESLNGEIVTLRHEITSVTNQMDEGESSLDEHKKRLRNIEDNFDRDRI